MSDTVVLTEYLGMKTGQGAKGPWVLHKAKDDRGRVLNGFGNVGQLLYENIGKKVIVEGVARKPEFPNDITVNTLTATGEEAPAPPASGSPATGMTDQGWREKEQRTLKIAVVKSFMENGDNAKIVWNSIQTDKGNGRVSLNEYAQAFADAALVAAGRVDSAIWMVEDEDIPF